MRGRMLATRPLQSMNNPPQTTLPKCRQYKMAKIAKSLLKETRLYNFSSLVESVHRITMQLPKRVLFIEFIKL